MPTDLPKTIVPKFPLRLSPSMRRTAEELSAKEGVSLNQFINVAVAEKLVRLQHEEWDRNRMKHTVESAQRAIELLDEIGTLPPEPGDELPEGYIPIAERARRKAAFNDENSTGASPARTGANSSMPPSSRNYEPNRKPARTSNRVSGAGCPILRAASSREGWESMTLTHTFPCLSFLLDETFVNGWNLKFREATPACER